MYLQTAGTAITHGLDGNLCPTIVSITRVVGVLVSSHLAVQGASLEAATWPGVVDSAQVTYCFLNSFSRPPAMSF